MEASIEIIAPARLHFGLLSFGQPTERQGGGLGVMIERPSLKLHLAPHTEWKVSAPTEALMQRIYTVAVRVCERLGSRAMSAKLPPLHVDLQQPPLTHVGLGSGTQLNMAVALGLATFFQLPLTSLEQLVLLAGRAERSSVGSYGFARGGLIAEAGKLGSETLGPLVARCKLPPAWRVLLVIPRERVGLSGEQERTAFAQVPAVPLEVTRQLSHEAFMHLLPAARSADFSRFGASLYRYGVAAGNCFATIQGSPFANERVAQIVSELRAQGIEGVGQSSWGPLVFAWFDNLCAADEFAEQFADHSAAANCELIVAAPANAGATINGLPLAFQHDHE